MLVVDDYQLPPIRPGASANKANLKPSYGSAFVMGIVKKGLNALNKLRENFVKLKTSKRLLSNENLLSTCHYMYDMHNVIFSKIFLGFAQPPTLV